MSSRKVKLRPLVAAAALPCCLTRCFIRTSRRSRASPPKVGGRGSTAPRGGPRVLSSPLAARLVAVARRWSPVELISTFLKSSVVVVLVVGLVGPLIVDRDVVVDPLAIVVCSRGRRSTRSVVGVEVLVEGLAEGVVDFLAEEGRRNMAAVGAGWRYGMRVSWQPKWAADT